jgi:serine/threonine protein kinase/Tfp pilus assembly protein PilF
MFVAQQDNGAGSAASLAPYTRIDRYEIRSLLGKGGMGEVYLAHDTTLRRLVALKLLPAAAAANEDRMRRFVQEAKAAAALSHPHIAQIFEIGEHNGTHFIAMELVDGVTLRDKIRSERTELRKLLKYLQQVAEGLAKAHAAGIVHRDLKPDNIMITRDDYAKILDFGLAKLLEPQRPSGSGSAVSSEVSTVMAQHSLAGMVMGTTGYMSPEQAQGKVKDIDQRSDIFSFGCILFEAVTGRRPFADESAIKSLHKVVYEAAPAIKDFNPSAPPDLQRVIRRCLAKDPEERYQTIKDVALELKEVRHGMAGAGELDTTGPSSGSSEKAGKPGIEQSTKPTSSADYLVSQIKSHKRSAMIILAALVIAAAALAYFSYIKPNRAHVLTEQDTILIADFDNKTGDALFDGTLKQALAVQLEQSPFLNIYSDERVREMLLYMRRSPDERVTRAVAREICQRQGLKAMLTGSIAPLGAHYVLELEAVNAQTGDVLARSQTEAESSERVLEALGRATTDLRQKLGESLRSIQKFEAPIEQATTSSLEALKVFSLTKRSENDRLKRISLLKRAIELDPNFAMAYVQLSAEYTNTGQPEAAAEAAQKAFELRDRVSEPERLDISIRYYSGVTGEWDKVIETAELWISTYPNKSSKPYAMLAVSYNRLGQFDKAAEAANQAIRLNPKSGPSYFNRGFAFLRLNRFAEAKQVFEQAIAQNLDVKFQYLGLYQIALINGDAASMQQQVDRLRGQSDDYQWFDWQAATAAYAGQWQKTRELSRRSVDVAAQNNAKEVAAEYASEDALRAAVFGQCQQSKDEATRALALARGRVSLPRSSLGLALCGEAAQVQRLVDEIKQRYPKDSIINGRWLPVIQAASEIKGGNPALAIQALEPVSRSEAAAECRPPYLRGQAYLKLGRGAEAAAEFQKILDHRGWEPLSPLYALAHLGLARAAVLSLDTSKARQAYQDFFALWKDADADLPALIEAKKEYEKLK